MGITQGLKPEKVFAYFEEIASIPHGSGNIDRISDFIASFAKTRNLFYIQDATKNVIIVKEASAGLEESPTMILQGHMDMVAVKKPDADIDMKKDALRLRIEGDELLAEDTSLGGDDGIAVAFMLAILDAADIRHPRLEAVFTVDEETGMDGARMLDTSVLMGKRLLNLDSEEEGIILAGCAGGARVDWKLPIKREYKEGKSYKIAVKGLLGGHSGTEIHKERGNANCLLGRVLAMLLEEMKEKYSFSISEMGGGLADNAIPRESFAAVVTNAPEEFLKEKAVRLETDIRKELQTKDPGFRIEIIESADTGTHCLSEPDVQKAVYMLSCAPNGVQAMSGDTSDQVETSLNVGIIQLQEETFRMGFSVRSSLEGAKKSLINRLQQMIEMAGGSQGVSGEYPGWEYLRHSPFREEAIAVYQSLYGEAPRIQAIHAGLECGLLAAKIKDLECISIGPDMKDIHTTEERLCISSTKRVWDFVLELLNQKQE